MKITLRLVLVLSLLLILSTPVSAQSDAQSPEEIVAASYEAINAGDIEAYMAQFAENAVATVGPWYTNAGKDEIRGGAQETFDAEVSFEYEILEADGAKVKTWSSHMPPDYDFPLEAMEEFVVLDGEIVYNSWDPTEETMALLAGPDEAGDQTDAESPEEVVLAIYDATNAGDLDAYMALLAEDAVVTVGPWSTFTTNGEIRASVQENMDANAQMEFEIESVANGLVTVWTSLTSEAYDFPLVAIEKYFVDDGKVIYNSWDPTEETMAILAPPEFGEGILNGVYGLTLDGVFLATEDDPTESPFNMAGALVADGEGNITGGARTLNLDGDLQADTVEGTYAVAENGTATITLNAYQDGEQVATEELACFVAIDGSALECIVTALSVPVESGAVSVPLVGSAHGKRLTE